ncbi:MAG: hypothetical protein PHN42_05790 [Bacilli bacterium]|nr:hypothetical protein [Bacilli bacterium]
MNTTRINDLLNILAVVQKPTTEAQSMNIIIFVIIVVIILVIVSTLYANKK